MLPKLVSQDLILVCDINCYLVLLRQYDHYFQGTVMFNTCHEYYRGSTETC
jgi:hypothetical protein